MQLWKITFLKLFSHLGTCERLGKKDVYVFDLAERGTRQNACLARVRLKFVAVKYSCHLVLLSEQLVDPDESKNCMILLQGPTYLRTKR